MAYIRREKVKRDPKDIAGDQSVLSAEQQLKDSAEKIARFEMPTGIFSADDPISDLADDLETLKLLEEMEEAIADLEKIVNDKIDEMNIPVGPDIPGEVSIDPETGDVVVTPSEGAGTPDGPGSGAEIGNMTILEALKTLNDGVPTSSITGDLFKTAFELVMDGSIHVTGVDPLRLIFNDFGTDPVTGLPLAPMPKHTNDSANANSVAAARMSCSELKDHKDQPDIDTETGEFTNPDVELSNVNTVLDKQKRITLWDLVLKLMNLVLYFIFKIPYDFLGKMGGRIVRRAVRGARNWCKRQMDKYYCYVTGECEDTTISDEEFMEANMEQPLDETAFAGEEPKPEVGAGLDCIVAAAAVMSYATSSMSSNADAKAYSNAKEQRQYHESMKHGEIMNIKNKSLFKIRIEGLDASTKGSPRDRRRFFGKRRKSYPW